MKGLSLFLVVLMAFSSCGLAAQSGRRKALLIANNAYTGEGFPNLQSVPMNDVAAVASVLTKVGFDKKDITTFTNLDHVAFLPTVIQFVQRLSPNDSVLVYYSGHGFSLDQRDYLVATDFSIGGSKEDARANNVALQDVLGLLSQVRNKVIILDACRTELHLMKNAVGPNTVKLEALSAIQGTGSLIGYSTSNGKASDAQSVKHLSLYTQFLVSSLETRPATMFLALSLAKTLTVEGSNRAQIPGVYDEMGGNFLLTGVAPPATPSNLSTWSDVRSGLMWTTSDNRAPLTLDQARYYCTSISLGGFSDWRLPEMNELRRIIEFGSKGPYHVNPVFQLSDRYVWTTSIAYSSATKDVYSLYDFKKTSESHDSDKMARALCVRADYGAAIARILSLARRNRLDTLNINHKANGTWYASISLPGSAGSWTRGLNYEDVKGTTTTRYSNFIYESVFVEDSPDKMEQRALALGEQIATLGDFKKHGRVGESDLYQTSDGLSLRIVMYKDKSKVIFAIYPVGVAPEADDYE